MDYATLVKAVKVSRKVFAAVEKYIDKDLKAHYGLKKPVHVEFVGIGIGIGNADAGPLHIRGDRGGGRCVFDIDAFAAFLLYWNGPNVIPDNWKDGSFEASLFHDLIWRFAKDIAAQTGLTEQEVMQWGNGIFNAAYVAYGKGRFRSRVLARMAYGLCEWSRKWWRKVFPVLLAMLATIALAAGCGGGCASPPDWGVDGDTPPIEWTTE